MTLLQSPISCCMLGAIAVQLLAVTEELKRPVKKRPDYRSIEYYVIVVASIGMAVMVGVIYFDGEPISHNRIVYFHTGASSPLLIRTLANTFPNVVSLKPKKAKS